ncbi:MAG TPA: hypothetical protein ENJ95_18150 [Bacteroidetes bacterium]|nr:hypothetical protein [Bacteroidota bacterium]
MYGEDKVFVLGFLIVESPVEKHEKDLAQIRSTYNYRTQLTYRSSDRFKVPFAKAALEYFMKTDGLVFVSQIISTKKGHKTPSSYQQQKDKIEAYKNLFGDSDNAKTIGEVLVKNQTPFGPSSSYQAAFKASTNAKLVAMNPVQSNLLQLADLLTGCVRGDKVKEVKNPSKLAVIQQLKSGLGTGSIGTGVDKGRKFIVKYR